ncbi:hypothetical protein PF005_g24818 [Phytophthora fragariae]|uniref:RxLR effector protein n=1 Tax=Phytophthora fragariae TaxID=53985 RepID=A0A6A3X7Q8_9STRA|nr:hypothetical protein PF003_g6202 [Phytophthora fragariae]KAE8927949.1 hypothetical protein PF009_g21889 [Phytophthora fragariae]KAE9086711.1 hypothetical protein PF007_g20663 [Phytophthora fragariae]KAE9108660.1 hypothetical protein PF006_g20831 [Phytophthora fragariae]KAE9176674.1 hypothetical protein PF005_g24818 [Phytophthora fragariae]
MDLCVSIHNNVGYLVLRLLCQLGLTFCAAQGSGQGLVSASHYTAPSSLGHSKSPTRTDDVARM